MATQILPQVHRITEAVRFPEIKQSEILELMNRRNDLSRLKSELEELELSMRARLDAGIKVEAGTRTASIKVTERRTPQWKTIVERELGAGYAANVLAHTKPSQSFSLIVS